MLGHSARFCQEHWKGKGNVPQTTFNTEVEEARPGVQQEFSELEFAKPRHTIGSVEITKPVPFVTRSNFQELADDEEETRTAPPIASGTWRRSRRMRRKMFADIRTTIWDKKGRKNSEDELLEVHSFIQGGHVGRKVPSWKQISNVILEEKDPSTRKEMIQWLERGMKKDNQENLVNNRNYGMLSHIQERRRNLFPLAPEDQ